jgi:hypothetical protein
MNSNIFSFYTSKPAVDKAGIFIYEIPVIGKRPCIKISLYLP